MKTIYDAAWQSYVSIESESDFVDGFMKGVEFAQRWISIKEELPEFRVEVQIKYQITINDQKEICYGYDKLILKCEDCYMFAVELDHKIKVIEWRPIEYK